MAINTNSIEFECVDFILSNKELIKNKVIIQSTLIDNSMIFDLNDNNQLILTSDKINIYIGSPLYTYQPISESNIKLINNKYKIKNMTSKYTHLDQNIEISFNYSFDKYIKFIVDQKTFSASHTNKSNIFKLIKNPYTTYKMIEQITGKLLKYESNGIDTFNRGTIVRGYDQCNELKHTIYLDDGTHFIINATWADNERRLYNPCTYIKDPEKGSDVDITISYCDNIASVLNININNKRHTCIEKTFNGQIVDINIFYYKGG
jgi:hypothetical protein